MAKKVLLCSGIALLLIVTFLAIWVIYHINTPCPPPKRPATVPVEAMWNGGCDGGFWLEFVSDSCNHFRFRIYHDWDGELELDALFAPTTNDVIEMDKNNWKEFNPFYRLFDPESYIYIGDSSNRISLRSIYPAYGGRTWEIAKEKHKLWD
ncbi:MAG: hypothetical protein LUH10_03910 [Tannerellaceae bacterium]|nr:hypothetical protein [Tannerellaceae bacterium]